MDSAAPPPRAVHCCACSRLVIIPELAGAGFELACPFCGTRQKLAEMTVLISEPLLPA
jgi:hypothetical protein